MIFLGGGNRHVYDIAISLSKRLDSKWHPQNPAESALRKKSPLPGHSPNPPKKKCDCWWQLRLVVYPIIYQVLYIHYISQVVQAGFLPATVNSSTPLPPSPLTLDPPLRQGTAKVRASLWVPCAMKNRSPRWFEATNYPPWFHWKKIYLCHHKEESNVHFITNPNHTLLWANHSKLPYIQVFFDSPNMGLMENDPLNKLQGSKLVNLLLALGRALELTFNNYKLKQLMMARFLIQKASYKWSCGARINGRN